MTRVLLVDDQPMIRAGLKMVLSATDDLEVVGELDDGDRIVDHTGRFRPDVVCMDVRMHRHRRHRGDAAPRGGRRSAGVHPHDLR
ncbi:MAG: response regulator [Actinomycetota bacterium]